MAALPDVITLPNHKPSNWKELDKLVKNSLYALTSNVQKTHFRLNPESIGEYQISPVTHRCFKRWVAKNEDLNLPLQYEDNTLTYNIMKRPNNAAGSLTVRHLVEEVESLIRERAELATYTGRITPTCFVLLY
jgi:hypothetical protein